MSSYRYNTHSCGLTFAAVTRSYNGVSFILALIYGRDWVIVYYLGCEYRRYGSIREEGFE